MLNFIKKLVGILTLLIAVVCTLGLIFPAHSMTTEEVMKGKAVFAVFGILFGTLAYYLLRIKK